MRRVQALDRGRVGAGDEQQVRVAPGGDRGLDLAHHLLDADHRLAAHVPAPLGRHLVLEVQPGDPGLLVGRHGAQHVDRVAVAGVRVGDAPGPPRRRRSGGRCRSSRCAEQADVRAAEQGGGAAEAGHVDHVEAGLLDQPRGERVVRPGREQRRRRRRAARATGPAATTPLAPAVPRRALPPRRLYAFMPNLASESCRRNARRPRLHTICSRRCAMTHPDVVRADARRGARAHPGRRASPPGPGSARPSWPSASGSAGRRCGRR